MGALDDFINELKSDLGLLDGEKPDPNAQELEQPASKSETDYQRGFVAGFEAREKSMNIVAKALDGEKAPADKA